MGGTEVSGGVLIGCLAWRASREFEGAYRGAWGWVTRIAARQPIIFPTAVVALFDMKTRFEDLKCWQMARQYRSAIYRATKSFPKVELFGLTNQLRRAACSVTANIAEGYGRHGFQDAAQFCVRARGSLNETIDQLYAALDEGYVSEDLFRALYQQGREVERVLNGYIAYLRSRGTEDRTAVPGY